MAVFRVFTLLSVLGLLPVAALADAPRAERLKTGAPVSVAAYGRQNPRCAEWTNGCVICVASGDHARCSTPGIACMPAGLTCKRSLKR